MRSSRTLIENFFAWGNDLCYFLLYNQCMPVLFSDYVVRMTDHSLQNNAYDKKEKRCVLLLFNSTGTSGVVLLPERVIDSKSQKKNSQLPESNQRPYDNHLYFYSHMLYQLS